MQKEVLWEQFNVKRKINLKKIPQNFDTVFASYPKKEEESL